MSTLDPDDTWPRAARAKIASHDLVSPPPLKKRRLESGWVATKTHTSGYDEILPTDTQTRLLSDMSGASATVPAGSSKALGGAHGKYSRKRSRSVYEAGEGVRMDTANTLLALPGGGVTFHSHAGGSTKGQARGHDVRRRAFARALAKPWSKKGDAVFAGGVMLASRPPGLHARTGVDSTKLRDQSALPTWETDRETAKGVVNAGFLSLPATEQTDVRATLQLSFDELNTGAPSSHQRSLAPVMPTSPRRSTVPDPLMPKAAAGGSYLLPKAAVPSSASVPGESAGALGRRASKPFRRTRKY